MVQRKELFISTDLNSVAIFSSLPDATGEISDMIADAVKAANIVGATVSSGRSNVSCSAYVNVSFTDDDGEEIAEFKVRVSDHDDRYGSDLTIRIDGRAEEAEDEYGDFDHYEIANWWIAEQVEVALAAVKAVAK